MPDANDGPVVPHPLVELIEALSDRQGELELSLEHVTLKFPMIPDPIELNGTLTVSMHLRELSDKEKTAHVAKRVRELGR